MIFYLDRLTALKETYCISNEIRDVLIQISNLKISEMISSRVGLCLILIKNPDEWPSDIPIWFKEKYSLTAENEYNMLLQATFFACELKTSLEKKYLSNDLCDPSPDYLYFALYFIEEDAVKFTNALKRIWW